MKAKLPVLTGLRSLSLVLGDTASLLVLFVKVVTGSYSVSVGGKVDHTFWWERAKDLGG